MCKRFYFGACAGESLLKDTEQKLQKQPVVTLALGPENLNLT